MSTKGVFHACCQVRPESPESRESFSLDFTFSAAPPQPGENSADFRDSVATEALRIANDNGFPTKGAWVLVRSLTRLDAGCERGVTP